MSSRCSCTTARASIATLALVPTLCLGEAIVDLVCERPVADLAEADAFRPHFGGAAGNVAYTAAAHGAQVALGGGAGDDARGRWLRARLGAGGRGPRWFVLGGGLAPPPPPRACPPR